jgi:HK97 family phage portal protein
MGILSTLRKTAVQARTQQFSLTDPLSPLAQPTAAGVSVTEESALRISTAWACCRIIAESLAALPWHLYHRDAEGNAELANDHDLAHILLRSPNRDMTPVEFRELLGMHLASHGNAYSYVERSTHAQRILSLTPLRPSAVRPLRKAGGNTKLNIAEGAIFYRVSDRGQPEDFPSEKIWHVRGFGADGLVGLSPIAAAREALGGSLAAEEFSNRFWSQGGMPAGTVSYGGWLTQEQRKVAREALQQLLGGLGNAHKFALFEGGVKPEPFAQMNLEDMQFVAVRKFSVIEICRFYRMPPHMVCELEKGASYASIEQQSLSFVQYTLLPYLTRIESSAGKFLLGRDPDHFLKFNFEGLLRADSAARAQFYASALQNGYMTRNEVRAKENLNRAPGLDDFTCQTNLAPVEDIGKQPQKANATVVIANGETLVDPLQALERVARMPRKLIVDATGEPVGSVPVEKL